MKGQRVWCQLEGESDLPRRHSFQPGLNQQAVNIEPIDLSKRR